jgi:predicted alpha/beta hydrolase
MLISDPLPRWVVGEPIPRRIAYQWRKWALSNDWFFETVPAARKRFARFSSPLLLCSSTDDLIAPPRAVEALAQCFHRRVMQRMVLRPGDLDLPKIGHVGLFRPTAEPVWEKWLDFLYP